MKKIWKKIGVVGLTSVVALTGALTLIGSVEVPSLTIESTTQASTNVESRFKECRESVKKFGHNNSKVVAMYDTLAGTLQKAYANKEFSEKQMLLIIDGITFAAEKHQFQARKDAEKTPYIIHPMGVTNNLIAIGKVYDTDIVLGALLHDTVEDTKTTFDEIKAKFGERVEGFVKETTDDKSLPQAERKLLQIVNAPHKSVGAAAIKLADKLYNLRDVYNNPPPNWNPKICDQYFRWAENVVEHLPKVNDPLRKEIETTISKYWQKQQRSDKVVSN